MRNTLMLGILVVAACFLPLEKTSAAVILNGSLETNYQAFLSGSSETYINMDQSPLTELYTSNFFIDSSICALQYQVDFEGGLSNMFDNPDTLLFRVFTSGGWQNIWSSFAAYDADYIHEYERHFLETGTSHSFTTTIDLTPFQGMSVAMGIVWVSDAVSFNTTTISNISFVSATSTDGGFVSIAAPSGMYGLVFILIFWCLIRKGYLKLRRRELLL